jgi:hypothetical protein
MSQSLSRLFALVLALFVCAGAAFAEDGKKLEDQIPLIPKKQTDVDLQTLKRAKLSEEQAINQLKYMMVKGFARMEEEMVETGGFPPFGLTLMPDGTFKAVIADTGGQNLRNEVVLAMLARQMEAIAQTRSVWGVGIMYIRKIKREDGSFAHRLIVMTEHIAGWARHWAYPYKVEDGQVKMGQPSEGPAEPIYFVKK